MVTNLWSIFPRLLEQNINGLLDGAQPKALKAFQIYRTCKNEGLWTGSLDTFAKRLDEFFSRPRADRRKSHFDVHLEHPMDHDVYSRFHLDFRTAVVKEDSLLDLASWAHNLIRVSKKTTGAFMSLEVMTKTLRHITDPAAHEKAKDIEFADFCNAWKKTVSRVFGNKHEKEFNDIVTELNWLNAELKKAEQVQIPAPPPAPVIYLTQTEIDWTLAVEQATIENSKLPKYPLSKGPQKQPLLELARIVSLFEVAKTSQLPEIVENRENIRATLLDRCDTLLGKKQKLAS
jgi:hypothetical protein